MAQKTLDNMTLEEVQAEMRAYPCDLEEYFAFISYSHQDREQVYPMVLSWMRQGYNIYIDLDFENHGSDANWIDQMSNTLARRTCRLAVCFKSVSYTYSYAALLELLTMRSTEVTRLHGRKPLLVDIIGLEPVPEESDLPRSLKPKYREAFAALQRSMGGEFAQANQKERQTMHARLTDWLDGMDPGIRDRLYVSSDTGDTLMGDIDRCYRAGMADFYPWIATLMKNWLHSQDLNGNTLPLAVDIGVRFQRAGVAQLTADIIDPPEHTDPPVIPPPKPSAVDLSITKVLGPTDVKYKILQCGTKFHVGFDQLVTVVMNGKTYKAKMHKTVKGRLDRLTELHREQGLAEGDTIEARYSATENTIYLEKV